MALAIVEIVYLYVQLNVVVVILANLIVYLEIQFFYFFFFFSSRRRHTRYWRDWSSDVCSSDLEGLDHAAYEVNGELILRASTDADPDIRSESTRREAALLAAVAELSALPVPEPIFADPEAGLLAYFKLPGVPLIDHPVSVPARLAPDLGELLGCLHQTPLDKVESLVERDLYPLAAWREDAERDYREIAEQLPAAYRHQ